MASHASLLAPYNEIGIRAELVSDVGTIKVSPYTAEVDVKIIFLHYVLLLFFVASSKLYVATMLFS